MASSGHRLDTLLAGLAEDRATGALRVGRAGTIYLTDGCVTYAESTVAPRIEEILTASSRVSATAVRRARRSAAGTADGGEALVRQGVLTRGELQFCVFCVTADAAYFVLAATGTRPRFRAGDRHWLGVHWHADVTGLIRECARRRAQLDNIWPSDELDAEPVVPVARPPGQRVVLTALQWELLVHADRAATPVELARRLGRPAYATLAAVRHLAAAGLLRRPEPARPKQASAPTGMRSDHGVRSAAPQARDMTAQATAAKTVTPQTVTVDAPPVGTDTEPDPGVRTAAPRTKDKTAQATAAETVTTRTVAVDTAPTDTVSPDNDAVNAGPMDNAPMDNVAVNAGLPENVAVDTMPVEAVAVNAGLPENVAVDTMPVEAVAVEAVPAETVPAAAVVAGDTAGDVLAANADGLPRRTPGAAVPGPVAGPPTRLAPAVNGDPTDVSLLIRLRKALEELL